MMKTITRLSGIKFYKRNVQSYASDLQDDDDQGLCPAQEGIGVNVLVLENATGDLVLALVRGTEMRGRRTETADRKVFPVKKATL